MKDFYLHAYDHCDVDKILKKLNACILKKQQCRLWLLCAEEYDYISINRYNISKFVFDSSFVETILVLGALEHKNIQRYTKLGINVTIWPTFWFYKTIADVDITNLKTKRNPNTLFICLNNRGHSHRVKTIDKIAEHNLLDDGKISWHDETVKNSSWFLTSISLESEKNKQFYQHSLPHEFNDCLINLVTESTVNEYLIDISEKTINAIIGGMPFIVVGCAGIHKKLELMGFELYTEIFDYEFDSFKNIDQRINCIVKQLDNIKKKYKGKYATVYRILQPKITYNKLQMLNMIDQTQKLPQEIINFPAYAEIINKARIKIKEIRSL